ncbi:MAG: hypothetical protein ACFFFG_04890 [Candidatus Thorarchaeota archaeon]
MNTSNPRHPFVRNSEGFLTYLKSREPLTCQGLPFALYVADQDNGLIILSKDPSVTERTTSVSVPLIFFLVFTLVRKSRKGNY